VLRKVIEEFKRLHYNNLIRGSKAIWNIVRENTGNTKNLNEIPKGLTYGFSGYFFKNS
jgi:hypothetical protein